MIDMKRIYLDNAASTVVDKKVKKEMLRVLKGFSGNPSAIHAEGRAASTIIGEGRKLIAEKLGARKDEIFFNSGGTESNNSVIFGVVSALLKNGVSINNMHIITTPFEHPSVYGWLNYFKEQGLKVDYLKVNEKGVVNPQELKELLDEDTILVSIMYVNNEIGVVQPLSKCAEVVRNFKKKKRKAKSASLYAYRRRTCPAFL